MPLAAARSAAAILHAFPKRVPRPGELSAGYARAAGRGQGILEFRKVIACKARSGGGHTDDGVAATGREPEGGAVSRRDENH
jgi:hypothetical protein